MTLSSRTHTLFSSSLPLMWCKSVRLVHNWELVDWYRDATSIPLGSLLIELSPRTENRLRYCTNNGSLSSKFFIPDRLKLSKISVIEQTKVLYSPSVPIIFPLMQIFFPSVLPKRVYQLPVRVYSKSFKGKPAKHKKTWLDTVSKRSSVAFLKRLTWKQRGDVLASKKGYNP